MTREIRIDWQRVALNLRSHGMRLETASVKLGRSRGWLNQIARGDVGTRVEFHDGLRLLDYHLAVCGESAHVALLETRS